MSVINSYKVTALGAIAYRAAGLSLAAGDVINVPEAAVEYDLDLGWLDLVGAAPSATPRPRVLASDRIAIHRGPAAGEVAVSDLGEFLFPDAVSAALIFG